MKRRRTAGPAVGVLDGCLEPGDRLRHARLELVGVPAGAAEERRGEDVAERRQPRRHRPPVHHPGAVTLRRELPDPAGAAGLGVPGDQRPGSTSATTLRVGQTTALRRLTPRYHCPGRSPPALSGIIRTSSGDSSGIRRTSPSTSQTTSGGASIVVSARSSRSAAASSLPWSRAGVWQPVPRSATLCRVLNSRLVRALAAPAVAAGSASSPWPGRRTPPRPRSSPVPRTAPCCCPGRSPTPSPPTTAATPSSARWTTRRSPSCPSGQSATYDLPPGTHVFRVRYVGLGTDPTPAQRIWTIRNVPCEQAGAAYQAAQGEFFVQQQKLVKAKKKLQRAKAARHQPAQLQAG